MELSIRGGRDSRPDSCGQAAAEVLDFVRRVRPRLPRGAKWVVIDRSFERVPALDAGVLDKVLRTSPPSRKSERAARRTTYDATLVCAAGGVDLMRLAVGFSAAEDAAKTAFYVEARLSAAVLAHGPGAAPQGRAFFEDLVHAFRLRSATGSPSGALRSDPSIVEPRVGWLTYLSRSLGPVPAIPPPTEVVRLDDLGWILVAQPEPVDLANPEHRASIAYVRHALGARVLLDGPSFPPPGAKKAPEPAIAPPEPVAEAQIPSYLKAPPPAVPPAAVPAITPLTTGTADIDLSKILKTSLPFDPHAAKSTPAKPSLPEPTATAEKPRAPDFGETEAFDLSAMLKRGPSVPFGPSTPAPAPPPPPAPAEPKGHGRWVRFNPQTGEPLATPRWEALPEPPKK